MDHQEAIQLMAVEKYLLNELPPELRDDFEEHYFDCPECATDLRATAAFLDAAKAELIANSASRRPPVAKPKRPFTLLWRPALIAPLLAASLLVIAYQNVVVYPRLNHQIAQSNTPEILPFPLAGQPAMRGGQIAFLYRRHCAASSCCTRYPQPEPVFNLHLYLVFAFRKILWHGGISAQQAKDTVSIRIPGSTDGGSCCARRAGTPGFIGPRDRDRPCPLQFYFEKPELKDHRLEGEMMRSDAKKVFYYHADAEFDWRLH